MQSELFNSATVAFKTYIFQNEFRSILLTLTLILLHITFNTQRSFKITLYIYIPHMHTFACKHIYLDAHINVIMRILHTENPMHNRFSVNVLTFAIELRVFRWLRGSECGEPLTLSLSLSKCVYMHFIWRIFIENCILRSISHLMFGV